MNLNYLKRLNIKGNRLSSLGLEAFQNLPELEDLDMAFNKLTTFDFSVFDQVGTLSYMFSVNVSHNKLSQLKTASDTPGEFKKNITCVTKHAQVLFSDFRK